MPDAGFAEQVDSDVTDLVMSLVRDVPDYPSPGVLFRDITPLLADHAAFQATIGALAGELPNHVDVIAGVEARGFILGAPVALSVQSPPLRNIAAFGECRGGPLRP